MGALGAGAYLGDTTDGIRSAAGPVADAFVACTLRTVGGSIGAVLRAAGGHRVRRSRSRRSSS